MVRTFPGIVNCTSIDWFLAWPDDALFSTAYHGIKDIPFQKPNLEKVINGVVKTMINMQNNV